MKGVEQHRMRSLSDESTPISSLCGLSACCGALPAVCVGDLCLFAPAYWLLGGRRRPAAGGLFGGAGKQSAFRRSRGQPPALVAARGPAQAGGPLSALLPTLFAAH